MYFYKWRNSSFTLRIMQTKLKTTYLTARTWITIRKTSADGLQSSNRRRYLKFYERFAWAKYNREVYQKIFASSDEYYYLLFHLFFFSNWFVSLTCLVFRRNCGQEKKNSSLFGKSMFIFFHAYVIVFSSFPSATGRSSAEPSH